jgi:hypothetical protein
METREDSSQEKIKKFEEEFRSILNDRQSSLLYGITDYNTLPKEQVNKARDILYKEFFN